MVGSRREERVQIDLDEPVVDKPGSLERSDSGDHLGFGRTVLEAFPEVVGDAVLCECGRVSGSKELCGGGELSRVAGGEWCSLVGLKEMAQVRVKGGEVRRGDLDVRTRCRCRVL